MNSPAGGLGRGLSSILTGPRHTFARTETLRDRFVDNGLASLASFGPLALCGYLHDPDGVADLTLRTPDLGSLHPTEAYQLMVALREVRRDLVGRHDLMIGAHNAMAVVVRGRAANGIFFFGDDALDERLVERLAAFCATYAPVILDHDLPADPDEVADLIVDRAIGDTRAEVRIGAATGSSTADRVEVAAAGAVLAALAPDARLLEVGEVRSDNGSGALVVAAADTGHTVMGAATVHDSVDHAAVLAAIRAARQIS